MNGKMQNGEKGVQKVSVECRVGVMLKGKKECFCIYFYREFIIVFVLTYEKSIYVGMTRGTFEKIVV
jgi:hypothetical protein